METIKKIFEELQSTNSKLEKEQILKINERRESLKETLNFILNPYITTGLSGKKMNKKVSIPPTINLRSAKEALEYLKNNNTGSDEIIANVQNFINQQPDDMTDFYKSIFTKSIKLGCAANTVNKVYGKGFIPQFEVMLAEKYFEHTSKVEGKDFTLTLKLDGIRCIAIKDGGSVSLFSRQGQQIEGLVDIEKELLNHRLKQFVLDGELLISDTTGVLSKDQYKATTKIVRKDGEKHGIAYRIFDCLDIDDFHNQKCKASYCTRRSLMESWMSGMEYIEVLPALYSGCDTSQILSWLDKVRAEGQEGIMISLNDAPYEFKRTQNLLKVKVMQDADLEITGFEEGQGRLTGTLGRLNVDYKGNVLGVGGGFSDEQRDFFWKNKEQLFGRVITVQYFEETQDRDGNVSLRFPVFKELREIGKKVSYS